LAGNLILSGSVANVIVMETASPRGEIGFWRFLRYGAVLTTVDLLVGFGLLAGERALGVPRWLGLEGRPNDETSWSFASIRTGPARGYHRPTGHGSSCGSPTRTARRSSASRSKPTPRSHSGCARSPMDCRSA